MEITTPAERMKGLAALTRASEVEKGYDQMPVAQMGGSGQMLEVYAAQRVALPRNHSEILQTIRQLAAVAGPDYYYRLPVKKKVVDEETGKEEWVQAFIEGPTITLANDLAREYGNCAIQTRVVDIGESWIIYARFVDIERGYTLERPFQQRKSQKSIGTKDRGRAEDNALQIGVSKAIRNVVVNALETFANYMFDEAKQSVVDKLGKDLPKHRQRVLDRLAEMNVDVRRVELVQGRVAKDWIVSDVAAVIANIKAISEGMTNAEDAWPTLESYKAADGEDNVDPKTGEIREPSRNDPPKDVRGSATPGASNGGGVAPAADKAATGGSAEAGASAQGGNVATSGGVRSGEQSQPVDTRAPDSNGAPAAGGGEQAQGQVSDGAKPGGEAAPQVGGGEAAPPKDDDGPVMSDLLVSLLDQIKQAGDADVLAIVEQDAKAQLNANEFGVFVHAKMLRVRELGPAKKPPAKK